MSMRRRLKRLAHHLAPRVFPDFVIVIEGLEPGGPPACTITTRFDPQMNATTTTEVWHEEPVQ